MSDLFTIVNRAISDISYGPLLQVNVSGNSRIYSDGVFTVPDMQITITPNTRAIAETELLWIVESGFSQTRPLIIEKVEKVIASHPKLELVLMVLISESGKYTCPKRNSSTWEEVCLNKSLQPISKFVPMRSDDKLFGPVDAMGHNWIHVSSIEYQVWLKPADLGSPDLCIDITADPTASGVSQLCYGRD